MEIQEIKQKLSLLKVLHHYGLRPDKHDMLVCPFHEDKSPSLKIYTKTNTFHCFGCSATGDGIQFIELFEKLSKHEAIEKAKTLVDPGHILNPTPMEQTEEKDILPRLAVLGKVAMDCKATFKRAEKAREYLKSRKLDPDKMNVGYIGTGLGKGWNRQLQESALQLGILKQIKPESYVPKFKNCVLFFTKNEKGQVIDLYGRSVIDGTENRHFYLNGHHQGIYPKYPEPGTKKLILTEAIIDCETLLQQTELTQHYSMISLFGTNGFTAEIQEATKSLSELEEVILFFDGDNAGQMAIIRVSEKLQEIRPTVKVTFVDTPKDEDINSLLQGHDPEIFAHLIKERKPISNKKEKSDTQDGQSILNPPETLQDPEQNDYESEPVLDTTNPDRITYHDGELLFTIWGGIEKDNIHRLKINLLVQLKSDGFKYYQDDVNLYSNGQLQRYIRGASEELEAGTTLLKTTIRKLQTLLEEYRLKQVEEEKKALKPKVYQMSRAEEQQAMNFLKSRNLAQNTLKAIEKSGLVGEQKNGLLLFFLYLSRLLDEPLHAIIYGKSGSGKTYLQTKISECLPDESVRTITSLTENTLYYSAKDFWKHKVLLIEDLEGVYNAFLPLREFMSKQSITKLTTDKDAKGNNVQKVLMVEGPICVSGATTQGNIYEDNANRSFLLHVDETPGHAREVMNYQRNHQAGLINELEQDQNRQILKNAQRLLHKVRVINPYAPQLDIPECVFKKLRTNMHYLKLIEIITFYHQHAREWKQDREGRPYIETTLEDIEMANWLVKDTLLRKSDELGGDLRSFFESLKTIMRAKENAPSFYAKGIREFFRMNPMKINRYLRELESRGFIQRSGGNRKNGFEYEIRSWDEYEKLKNGVNILDDILKRLREKEVKPAFTKVTADEV
jgi:DNA primase catalytic core